MCQWSKTLKAYHWHSCMQWFSRNKNWIQLPSFSFIDDLSWSHVNMSYLHVSDCQIINTGPITIFRVRLGVKFFTYFWIALFRCCLFSIASEPKIFEFPLTFSKARVRPEFSTGWCYLYNDSIVSKRMHYFRPKVPHKIYHRGQKYLKH